MLHVCISIRPDYLSVLSKMQHREVNDVGFIRGITPIPQNECGGDLLTLSTELNVQ